MADPELIDGWRTPGGHVVSMIYRPDTTDWNTIASILTHDEYRMPRNAPGTYLDIGAHVGAWSIGVALDNPGSTVIAVEALPENADLIRRNAERNGVSVTVYNRSAGTHPLVHYGTEDRADAFEFQHRYIGGIVIDDEQWTKGLTIELPTISLSEIVAEHGPISGAKIDCEGCEWSFLDDPGVGQVGQWWGERHPRAGCDAAKLRALLESTHHVTTDDTAGLAPFTAVRW